MTEKEDVVDKLEGVKLHDMKKEDYIYCLDCNEFVDFWKYGHNLEDCGHDKCKWRYVTEKELKDCIRDCVENGCFEVEK